MKNSFITWEDAVNHLVAQPAQKRLVEACYYDRPLSNAADRYFRSEEFQAFQEWVPKEKGKVLDIGAGQGVSSYAFAKEGWDVTALEPDPSDVVGVGAIRNLARQSGLKIETVQEFGEKLPFADASFELVFARQVLHHARDLPQLCREIGRVLKPGGKFIAARDHVISRRSDLAKFFAIHPLHKLYGGENAFLLKEYTGAIQAAGLRLERIIKPFESVINYGPRTKQELQNEFRAAISRVPLMKFPAKLVSIESIFDFVLRISSLIDNRPGRLYSFVASKPIA